MNPIPPNPPLEEPSWPRWLVWLPLPASLAFLALMAIDSTRRRMTPLLSEYGPLEIGTFLGLALGGLLGLAAAISGRGLTPWWHRLLMALLGLGLFLVAMEEIAWGQTFLRFESPAFFAENNRQGETTLHNLEGLHGKFHLLYAAFALGGLIGTFGPFRIQGLRVVPRLVVPTLSVVLALSFLQFLHTTVEFEEFALRGVQAKVPELVEFWIACVGLVVCAWNRRLVRSLREVA